MPENNSATRGIYRDKAKPKKSAKKKTPAQHDAPGMEEEEQMSWGKKEYIWVKRSKLSGLRGCFLWEEQVSKKEKKRREREQMSILLGELPRASACFWAEEGSEIGCPSAKISYYAWMPCRSPSAKA